LALDGNGIETKDQPRKWISLFCLSEQSPIALSQFSRETEKEINGGRKSALTAILNPILFKNAKYTKQYK
jgi:hypothetical protein